MTGWKKLMLLPIGLALAGCPGLSPVRTTGITAEARPPICRAAWFKPIEFSTLNDTPETVEQVNVFNAGRDAYCK